ELGGAITVGSRIGVGTVFRVSLPRAARRPPRAERILRATEPGAGRRGQVLVVDDEPMVGKAVTRALSGQHDVVATTRPTEALEKIRAGARFDVILCDLMMPELSGMDLYAELLRCAPEQARSMIVLSGGACTAPARAF